jgi:hypothetical protein
VSLAPLTEADIARLVGQLLGQVLLPAELQAALLAQAGGNPLYAEEYVRMLDDRGYLERVGGSWRLEWVKELPLPESVQGIIAARLDALAPEEKAVLQDAAVIGKSAGRAPWEPSPTPRRLGSRSGCTPWSASSSCAASAAARWPGSASTPSGTCWSATSPTRSSPGRRRPIGTDGRPSGYRAVPRPGRGPRRATRPPHAGRA